MTFKPKSRDFETAKKELGAFFGPEILTHYGTKREFKAGTTIFREGEKGDYLFIIKSGKVKVYTVKKGKEKIVAKLGEGSIVGEMAVITGKPRSASVETINDTTVFVIDREALALIFKDHPKVREVIGAESIAREEKNIALMLEDESE